MLGSIENCYHCAPITSYSAAEKYSKKYDTDEQIRYE